MLQHLDKLEFETELQNMINKINVKSKSMCSKASHRDMPLKKQAVYLSVSLTTI